MPNANYTHTITLYNCLRSSDSPDKREKWYRHIINSCFYKCTLTDIQNGTQITKSSTYTVRVPETSKYRPYCEWKKLSDDERRQYFTFSTDDIVVYGECMEEIEGTQGKTAAQFMLRNKPDSFKITAVSDNTRNRFARHYRLGG